jgi:hypothetical protein
VFSAFKPLSGEQGHKPRPWAIQHGNGMTEAAHATNHFSKSMFVIEVEGTPTAIFETKWHVDADLICRTWTNNHSEQLLVKGRSGLQFPPIIKLRLARPDEIATYAADNAKFEVQEGRRIAYLRLLGSSSDGPE